MKNGQHIFFKQFNFTPSFEGYVGLELELYIVDHYGNFMPIKASEILHEIQHQYTHLLPYVSYEIGEVQLELVFPEPIPKNNAACAVDTLLDVLQEIETLFNIQLVALPSAPRTIPLDIFPTERYLDMTKDWSDDKKYCAIGTTGLHVHIGMSTLCQAIRTHNTGLEILPSLLALYQQDQGRQHIMEKMGSYITPEVIISGNHLYQQAQKAAVLDDYSGLYTLVRISAKHGTVEFRLGDSTKDPTTVKQFIADCYTVHQ